MLIDIHTHHQPADDIWRLSNFYKDFSFVKEATHCSVGLHAWYITREHWQEEFALMQQYTTLPQVLAIGECGLDTVCATEFALQEEVFKAHIRLANELKKPLIIHCVRAYLQILDLLQQQDNAVPVIFHGFNRSKSLAKQIVTRGHYVSLGKAALNPTFHEIVRSIPPQQLFLETDDAALGIHVVYEAVATALGIEAKTLEDQVFSNAVTLFGKDIF